MSNKSINQQNSQPSIFKFEQSEVRVISIDGEPWFVAKDLCDVLGISNSRDAVAKLDDDEKDDVGLTDAIGRNQDTAIVSESGMYSLVLKSRKEQAKIFKKWITSEVLPSIRKTGKYEVEQKPKSNLELAQLMLDELKQHEQRLSAIELENIELRKELEAIGELADANSDELERFRNGHGYWYSIVGYYRKHDLGQISLKESATIGRRATALCKKSGIKPEKVTDPRFGSVNTYPEHILDELILS